MKVFVFLIQLLFISTNSFSQQNLKFAEKLVLGSSIAFIPDTRESPGNLFDEYYLETTWYKDLSLNLTKRIYFGFSHQLIHALRKEFNQKIQTDYYNIAGIFIQYDFVPKSKSRLMLELSYNIGNYCTCGKEYGYKKDNLKYLGFAFATDIPIKNRLSLDAGFNVYHLLNEADESYTKNIYILGLNYNMVNPK